MKLDITNPSEGFIKSSNLFDGIMKSFLLFFLLFVLVAIGAIALAISIDTKHSANAEPTDSFGETKAYFHDGSSVIFKTIEHEGKKYVVAVRSTHGLVVIEQK